MQNLRSIVTFFLAIVAPLVLITLVLREASVDHTRLALLKEQYATEHQSGVDHGKHTILQQDFNNPHLVTAACLSCHTERGKEVLGNAHWNWEREAYIPGKGVTYLGKKSLINNFCTGIASNEGTCNRCHIGYGWKDKHFDFTNEYNIDCLVCHDNTGTYEKARGGAGYPPGGSDAPDYRTIVANVGLPKSNNCGYCHFHGGGGNNVKHGDLEMALLTADRSIDVHMGVDGMNMQCVACHTAENHQMLGRYYGVSSSNTQRATCEQCHGSVPHSSKKLNEHTYKVACQTCHIPVYAKVNATKMSWDWSTATQRKEGLPYQELDSLGNELYTSIKGDFSWRRNVSPEYLWFNGTADHHLITEKIDPENPPLRINTLFGSFRDINSKIYPVKVHRGKQPYDTENLTIIQPKLWDKEANKGALWVDLDWEASLRTGMEYLELPYSGKHDFIETEMYLPINHMVSLSSQSLQCKDCHTRADGRLDNLTDFYMPGRDYNASVETLGVLLIILSILGVVVHAAIRIVVGNRKTQETK
jgi:octaheme c-type cytochrome (tetrathionate reductase family)